MAKHFMSILGNTLYAVCDYTYKGKFIRTTPYVQTAVLKRFFKNVEKKDRVTIFLTEDAEKKNWEKRPFGEQELYKGTQGEKPSRAENNGYTAFEEKKGLNTELQEVLGEVVGEQQFDINTVIHPVKGIPEGKTEEELWELFEVIYKEIKDDDEIYFDITNSFRFMPMMVMTILNYAQTLKNISVKGIYYGEYDPQKYQKDKHMSIIDISMLQSILEMSKATEIFKKYGIAEPIKDVTEVPTREKQLVSIKQSLSALNDLTSCIQCGRGKEQKSSKASIQAAYHELEKKKVNLEDDKGYVNIIKPLYDNMNETVKRFDCKDNVEIGLATIAWCIQYKQIQQGFTALEETITSVACMLCGVDETKSCLREKLQAFMMGVAKSKRSETEAHKNNKKMEIDKKELEQSIPMKELVNLLASVSQSRNSLNHFGFDKSSGNGGFKCGKFEKELGKYNETLKEFVVKNRL